MGFDLPKTLVIGAKGYLGKAFYSVFRASHPDSIGTHHQESDSLKKLDLSNPTLKGLDLNGYSYGILAAACANVQFCEKNPKLSYLSNVQGTLKLVEEMCEKKIVPILFSTDYVFDGKTGFYEEESLLNPLNEYGRQKAELERSLARDFKGNYLLIRLSKVYGLQKGDGSLIDQIAASLLKSQPVRVLFDLIFCPVAIDDVIRCVLKLQEMKATGVYQVCGNEPWSRFDLAQAVCRSLGSSQELICPIPLEALNEPFLRPKKIDMINRKVCETTNLQMRGLNESIEIITRQYQN